MKTGLKKWGRSLLSGRIDRGDMKNITKTLELEYRIAELEEKLKEKMP